MKKLSCNCEEIKNPVDSIENPTEREIVIMNYYKELVAKEYQRGFDDGYDSIAESVEGYVSETKRKGVLPKRWFVKKDENNPMWECFKKWFLENDDWDDRGFKKDYYGVAEGRCYVFVDDEETIKKYNRLLSLEQWHKIIFG